MTFDAHLADHVITRKMIKEESPLFTFRELKSEADYQAMVRVRQECLHKYQGDFLSPEADFPSIELLALSFPLTLSSKEDQTLILAEIEEEIIGYHHIFWWQHRQGMSYGHRGYRTPEWRGHGIGQAMLNWAEESLRGIGERHSGAKQFRTSAADNEIETIQRLLERDYLTAGSLTEMVYDLWQLPEPKIPLDFEIRPAEPATFRQIWQANEAVFSAEPQRSLPDEVSYHSFLEEPGFDPSLWSVIWAEDQVVGVAFSEITNRSAGHISQLSVGEQWRRLSLGRSLVLDSLQKLRKRGVNRIYVAADSDNVAALKLYQKCGFRPVAIYNRYWKSWN